MGPSEAADPALLQQANPKANVITTRILLACGALAGPLFLAVFLLQIIIRPGFDFIHSEPSQLSIGPLGWIQVANIVTAGLLVMAAAVGARRILRSGKGGAWGPLLLGVFGLCEVGVGVFVTDPTGPGHNTSLHGVMHLVFGGIGFVTLMASCFVFARSFSVLKQKQWAIFSAVTGLEFIAAFVAAAGANQSQGSIQPFLNLTFVLEWIWVSLISTRLMKTTG